MNETRTSLLRRLSDLSDQVSWGDFVSLYEPLLLSYVVRLNARCQYNLSDADLRDVVQTIFVSLVRKLPTFQFDRSRGRFRTWLWQVTHNAVRDWLRTRNRIRATEEGYEPAQANGQDPDEEWIKEHRQRVMQFCMEKVRSRTVEKTWKCFELHLLQGKSGADVGAMLGLPANTVYVNASRVLERIREEVALHAEDLGDD